jgi:RecG-like helicase
MAITGFRKRLRASVEELDRDRLEERYSGLDVSPIGEAPRREPARVAGEVQAMTVVPRATSPSLEVVISDGTGKVVGIFLGRRRVGGLRVGTGVVLEGVLQDERNRVVMLNPAYVLLD